MRFLQLLLLTALGAVVVFAQEAEEPERDPFAPSEEIKNAADRTGFVAQEEPDALPVLALRGYAEDETGQAVALLEIEREATYLVRSGDTVSIPRRGANLVLRIKEMDNLSLQVEIGELRRLVVVR